LAPDSGETRETTLTVEARLRVESSSGGLNDWFIPAEKRCVNRSLKTHFF